MERNSEFVAYRQEMRIHEAHKMRNSAEQYIDAYYKHEYAFYRQRL